MGRVESARGGFDGRKSHAARGEPAGVRCLVGAEAQSGEDRQYDFTGAGTVLLQSSEKARSDPYLVQQLEGQVGALDVPGLSHL